MAHEKNGHAHFTAYTKKDMDAVEFTAGQFSKDIKAVVELIFAKAGVDKLLESNISNHIRSYRPIIGKFA